MLNMKLLFFACCFVLLAGCAEPIEESRLSYVGRWENAEMLLIISRGGRVSYRRNKGGVATSIDAPLTQFIGDDFEVGFFFMTTRFDVAEPPHQVDGVWQMVVDEQRLLRTH